MIFYNPTALHPPANWAEGIVLLVDKPKDWTSFDVVAKIRGRLKKLTGIKNLKVGHAGTLDPMATGLLIICVGKATKSIDAYMGLEKKYTGTMTLGATTPSYDAETAIDQTYPTSHITAEALNAALPAFTGAIQQVPPMFSAIKKEGTPLYAMARKGTSLELEPRPVHIHQFLLTRMELPEADFEVTCSKGTYIRSLAFDLGKAVGSGAYLSALRRTAIGPYLVSEAWTVEDLIGRLEL